MGAPTAATTSASSPGFTTPPPARWELYRLLSDPTRLRLLALTATEELAVSELAELLREGQPKVSRHAAALREAGLLHGRKQGTWLLLRLAPEAGADLVIADALTIGRELCRADGTLDRIGDLVAARDAATREFFARGGKAMRAGPPAELAAYLRAIAPLIESRGLAIDAGSGDGSLLEVLAPLFDHVIAVDRSQAQLDLARERACRRQFRNVSFVCGELDAATVRRACADAQRSTTRRRAPRAQGADAVFAARVLHHAAVPARAFETLVSLARKPSTTAPGGAVLVLDYEAHRDEALREQQADLWLGFTPEELKVMAEGAGLCEIEHARLPGPWCGEGPDRHLNWQLLSGRRAS